MIQFPRRSVTRFFIPLIDVLTLLFCIFLLMPMIKETGEGQESAYTAGSDRTLSGTASQAGAATENRSDLNPPGSAKNEGELSESDRLRKERAELEQLRNEKINVLQQRLYIRVLEIDPDTGKLFYRDSDGVHEIASQADALDLIARQKREAGNRELYYLFLFPRRLTGYPEQRQLERYDNWFKSVAHGTDNPLSER
jgi:hypothetical protein